MNIENEKIQNKNNVVNPSDSFNEQIIEKVI